MNMPGDCCLVINKLIAHTEALTVNRKNKRNSAEDIMELSTASLGMRETGVGASNELGNTVFASPCQGAVGSFRIAY